MITVMVDQRYESEINPDLLEAAAMTVLELEEVNPDSELSIVVEGDERLQELNLQFLGIDSPTDVLSFPADEIDPDTNQPYIGDIILSYPRALAQSQEAGESINDELQLLVVHGALHLLGFDHASPEQKDIMWAAQKKALNRLGCKITHYPE